MSACIYYICHSASKHILFTDIFAPCDDSFLSGVAIAPMVAEKDYTDDCSLVLGQRCWSRYDIIQDKCHHDFKINVATWQKKMQRKWNKTQDKDKNTYETEKCSEEEGEWKWDYIINTFISTLQTSSIHTSSISNPRQF